MRNLEFDTAAFEDLAWWVQQDRKKAMRIMRLILDTQTDPFGGIGAKAHPFSGFNAL